jgi:hypothetical protein
MGNISATALLNEGKELVEDIGKASSEAANELNPWAQYEKLETENNRLRKELNSTIDAAKRDSEVFGNFFVKSIDSSCKVIHANIQVCAVSAIVIECIKMQPNRQSFNLMTFN